jgi:F0F1-type ATP synthase assembly protein I
MDDETRKTYFRGLALFSSILADLIGYTGAGVLLGWALAKWARFSSTAMIVFGALGLGFAFFRIYQRAENWTD